MRMAMPQKFQRTNKCFTSNARCKTLSMLKSKPLNLQKWPCTKWFPAGCHTLSQSTSTRSRQFSSDYMSTRLILWKQNKNKLTFWSLQVTQLRLKRRKNQRMTKINHSLKHQKIYSVNLYLLKNTNCNIENLFMSISTPNSCKIPLQRSSVGKALRNNSKHFPHQGRPRLA